MKIRISMAVIALLALISFLTGCRAPLQTPKPPQNSPTIQTTSSPQLSPEAELSVSELIKQRLSKDEKRAGMLHAWSRVPNNVYYRVAQKGDVADSFMTFDYGELAGAYGLATLIVDKRAKGPNRMSLIIFVERPNNRSDIYWIYKDMDLSKYRMSRSAGTSLLMKFTKTEASQFAKYGGTRRKERGPVEASEGYNHLQCPS